MTFVFDCLHHYLKLHYLMSNTSEIVFIQQEKNFDYLLKLNATPFNSS